MDNFTSELKLAFEKRGWHIDHPPLTEQGRVAGLFVETGKARYAFNNGALAKVTPWRPWFPGRPLNFFAEPPCASRSAMRSVLIEAGIPCWDAVAAHTADDATLMSAIAAKAKAVGVSVRLRPDAVPIQSDQPASVYQYQPFAKSRIRHRLRDMLETMPLAALELEPPDQILSVYVVAGRARAAQFREPISVAGNGQSPIIDLITRKHQKIDVNATLVRVLGRQDLHLASRLDDGQKARLANVYDGANGFDATDIQGPIPDDAQEIITKIHRALPQLRHGVIDIGWRASSDGLLSAFVQNIAPYGDPTPFLSQSEDADAPLITALCDLLDDPETVALNPWIQHAPSFLDATDPSLYGLDVEGRVLAHDLQKSGIP